MYLDRNVVDVLASGDVKASREQKQDLAALSISAARAPPRPSRAVFLR